MIKWKIHINLINKVNSIVIISILKTPLVYNGVLLHDTYLCVNKYRT